MPVRRGVGGHLGVSAAMALCNMLPWFATSCLYITAVANRYESCAANIALIGAPVIMYRSLSAIRTADNGKNVARWTAMRDVTDRSGLKGRTRKSAYPLDSAFEIEAVVVKCHTIVGGGSHAAAASLVPVATAASLGLNGKDGKQYQGQPDAGDGLGRHVLPFRLWRMGRRNPGRQAAAWPRPRNPHRSRHRALATQQADRRSYRDALTMR